MICTTRQLSIYFGAIFITGLGGASWNSPEGLYVGSVAFSGFFTYEICRKLDPTLPKVGVACLYLLIIVFWG